jgi:hypothetical protein
MNLKKVILQVLEEGHYNIPREVFQDMMDYYLEMYKKFRISGGKRVTEKAYPPKTFHPDFSKVGKSFEWAKQYNPSVTLQFTANNYAQWCKRNSADNTTIQLSLNDAERVYTEVMEHELLHSLQFLLKHYEQTRRGQMKPEHLRGDKKKLPNVEYAGMPKKKFINQHYDWYGYPKDRYRTRRTTHENRPIEYYPDLFSSIKSMQRSWFRFAAYYAMDEKALKSEEKKKNFYMQFFNNIKYGKNYSVDVQRFIPSLASKIFERFKNQGDEFLNMMLNKLYDGFVNKDPDFSMEEFEKIKNQTEEGKVNAAKEKSIKAGAKGETFTFDKRSLKLDYYDRGQIFEDVNNPEAEDYLDGSRSENADWILSSWLGFESKEDKRSNEYVLFPSKLSNVIRLLKKISGSKYQTFDSISREASDAIWDGVFDYFAKLYKKSLSTEGIPDLDRKWFHLARWDQVEERKQSKANYDRQVKEYTDKFNELIDSIHTPSL